MKSFYSLGIKLESSLLIVNFASTATGANFNKTTFNLQIKVQDISLKTGLHPQDIVLSLMLLGFIWKMDNKFILAIDWTKVDDHMVKVEASLTKKTRYFLPTSNIFQCHRAQIVLITRTISNGMLPINVIVGDATNY